MWRSWHLVSTQPKVRTSSEESVVSEEDPSRSQHTLLPPVPPPLYRTASGTHTRPTPRPRSTRNTNSGKTISPVNSCQPQYGFLFLKRSYNRTQVFSGFHLQIPHHLQHTEPALLQNLNHHSCPQRKTGGNGSLNRSTKHTGQIRLKHIGYTYLSSTYSAIIRWWFRSFLAWKYLFGSFYCKL